MLLPCAADGLDGLAMLTKQYGPLVGKPVYTQDATTPGYFTENDFQANGMDISVISKSYTDTVLSITISRGATFNIMEIPDILKPLSSTGTWTQKDDSTWALSNSKIKARWDGEGKISVGSD